MPLNPYCKAGSTPTDKTVSTYPNDSPYTTLAFNSSRIAQRDDGVVAEELDSFVTKELTRWQPLKVISNYQIEPVLGGYSGLYSYRLSECSSNKAFFAKSLSCRSSLGGLAAKKDEFFRNSLSAEAMRTEAVASLGLSPAIVFKDPQKIFYITNWFEGRQISEGEARSGPFLDKIIHYVDILRTAAFNIDLDSRLNHWLHRVPTPQVYQFCHITPDLAFLCIKVEDIILREIEQHKPLPKCWVHSDLKPQNILINDRFEIRFIDWCHLHIGCPMSAFAYFISSANVEPEDLPGLERRFKKQAPNHPFDRKLLCLNIAYIDLKYLQFFSNFETQDIDLSRHYSVKSYKIFKLLQFDIAEKDDKTVLQKFLHQLGVYNAAS